MKTGKTLCVKKRKDKKIYKKRCFNTIAKINEEQKSKIKDEKYDERKNTRKVEE